MMLLLTSRFDIVHIIPNKCHVEKAIPAPFLIGIFGWKIIWKLGSLCVFYPKRYCALKLKFTHKIVGRMDSVQVHFANVRWSAWSEGQGHNSGWSIELFQFPHPARCGNDLWVNFSLILQNGSVFKLSPQYSDQSQFGTLMNCELFEALRSKFCIVHISIPGMDQHDSAIPAGCYPTMDQMAEMIPFVRYLNRTHAVT